VALGDRISGILGNDEKLVQKLISAGKKTGEKIWELPLDEEYKEELKSPIADLKNVGGNYGGTINGALFIQEFVGKNKWAHIDIAGPSWTDRARDYETRGGTGVMLRTFAEFLENL
jgi:leucyl aminopeptidase